MLTLGQIRARQLHLHARCERCGQVRRVPLPVSGRSRAEHYNLVMLLDSRRVRCRACGGAPAKALWVSQPPARRRVLEDWPLDSARGWTPPEVSG